MNDFFYKMMRIRAILPFLFFFLLPLLLFWPVLWGNATLVPFDNLYEGLPWATYRAELGIENPHNGLVSDLVLQNFQWKQFAVSQYLEGELPLWQPRQFAGSPFLAAGQHSMLYPLSLLFLILPIHMAFGWFIVFSLALAGMTMYLFARVLGLRKAAAMLAGLTYQGSGFLTISVVFPMIVAGAVWLPLLLAAIHRLAQIARGEVGTPATSRASHSISIFMPTPIPWIAVGAIAIGMAALAGHVEILYYTLLVGGLYALWQLIRLLLSARWSFKDQPASEQEGAEQASGATRGLRSSQGRMPLTPKARPAPLLTPSPAVASLPPKGGPPGGIADCELRIRPKGTRCKISEIRNPKSEIPPSPLTSSPSVRNLPSKAGQPFSFVGWGLAMLLIGLLLGAAQMVPLYEMVSQNFREGSASLEQVRGYAWPIRQASTLLVPDLLGNPTRHEFYNLETGGWEPIVTQQPIDAEGNTISIDHVAWFKGMGDWKNYVEGAGYLGILPLLLALVALWATLRQAQGTAARERRATARDCPYGSAVLFFAILSILSLFFIFGTPLYAILFYGLPGWSQLHTPFRWVFPLTLSISMMGGIGWQLLIGSVGQAGGTGSIRASQRLVNVLGWVTFGSGMLGLVALLTMWLAPGGWIGQAAKLLDRSQLTQWAFGGSAALFISYQWVNFIHFGLALTGAGLVILLALRSQNLPSQSLPSPRIGGAEKLPSPRIGGGAGGGGRSERFIVYFPIILALLVTLLDLTAAGWGFMPATAIESAEFRPPSLQWLAERHEAGKWRYTALEKDWKVLNANSAMEYGLEGISGYDSIILKHYVNFMEALGPQEQLDFNRIGPLYNEVERHPDQELLDLLNVRYIVTDQVLQWRGWSLAYDDEVRIYQNEDRLPRAFLLGNGVYWGRRSEEIPHERLRELDPREEVLLQGPEASAFASKWEVDGREPLQSDMPFTPVQITSYTPNEIIMKVAPPKGAWLVLSDVDYADWRVFSLPEGGADDSEESERPVMRANGAFRAVWLNAGPQTVRWRYSPNSVKSGFFASFLGVAALGLAAAYWAWGRIYQEQENEGTVRRVAKNSFAPMALQLFNKLIDTVFAAFMARLLGPESLGQYAFAIALIWYFIIFSNFGLGTLLTRDVARDRGVTNRLFNTTLLLRVGLYVLSFPLLLLLLWLWPRVDEFRGVAEATLEPTTVLAIFLLAIGLIPSNLADAVTAVFRAYEKFEIPALVATIATFVKVSVGAGVLLAGYGIVGLAATSIVTNIVTLIILTWLMVRLIYRPRLQFERLPLRSMLYDALPLMINEFLATAFFRIDQVMLKPMRSNAEAGYYNVSYKFIDGLLILPSSFTLAIFPVMSRYAQAEQGDDEKEGERKEGAPLLLRATVLSLRWLIIIALPLTLLTTRYADSIVWAFGGPEYLPESGLALKILIWFLPFSFINSLLQYVLIAANRQHSLTRAYLVGLLFNVIANFFAIRSFGLHGAAAVTIFSEIALLLPFYRLMRESVGYIPWLTLFSKPLIALLIAALPLWAYPLPFWSAIPTSVLLYALSLLLLRTFGQEDRQILAKLLPARFAAPLGLGTPGA